MTELGGKDAPPLKTAVPVEAPEPVAPSINDIDVSATAQPKKSQTVTHVNFAEMLSKSMTAAPPAPIPLIPAAVPAVQTQQYWNQYAAYQQYGYQIPQQQYPATAGGYAMPLPAANTAAAYAAYGYTYPGAAVPGTPQAYMAPVPSVPYVATHALGPTAYAAAGGSVDLTQQGGASDVQNIQ